MSEKGCCVGLRRNCYADNCDDCKDEQSAENVAHESKDPKARYYDAGGVEVLDVIKAKLTHDQYKGWLLGNLIKYSCRANHKGQFQRDIEKVRFYSTEMFNEMEV